MKKRLFFTAVLIVLSTSFCYPVSSDKQTYGSLVVSEITSIYDGDTFRCSIPDVHSIIGNRISIRIAGIDTPEIRDKRPNVKRLARKAKQFTVAQLRAAKRVELRNVRRGKYFRIVADVYVDGKNLGEMLITAKLAKPYDGGVKPKW